MPKNSTISPALVGLSLGTTLLTWFLIILGGVVHGTGSSLACPDWPTCHGTFFPEMVGGVAIEHTHRLVASTVGLLTILMVVFYWRSGKVLLRNLSLLALALVIFQGVLGGITVLYQLPPAVSIGHLATSMAFLALMVWISALSVQDYQAGESIPLKEVQTRNPAAPWVLIAMLFTYLQLILGGMVRHLGAGLACVDIPLCQGSLWPAQADFLLQLHMLHRIGALGVTVAILVSAIQVWRRGPNSPWVRFLTGNSIFLLLAQVGFGLLSVASYLDLFPVSIHLALGALLWVNLVLLYFSIREAQREIEGGDQASQWQEATAT